MATSSVYESEKVFTVGDTEMRILPKKCLVSGMKVGSWDVLYRAEETENLSRAGIPLMIPNFSSLKDEVFGETGTKLPNHGFGRHMEWTTLLETKDGMTVCLDSNEETMKVYPFNFNFMVKFTNLGYGEILHETTIHNLEFDKEMPIQPGLHPYFNCPHYMKPQITTSIEGFDAKDWQWENKENTPDYNVDFMKNAKIFIPGKGSIELDEMPMDNGDYFYKKIQIWSDRADAADHDFVCFEPVSWGADGLNNSETRINVPARSSVTLTMKIKATPI